MAKKQEQPKEEVQEQEKPGMQTPKAAQEFGFKPGTFEKLIEMTAHFANAEKLGVLDYRSAYRQLITYVDQNVEKK